MSGFDSFQKKLFETITPLLTRLTKTRRSSLLKSIENDLLGIEGKQKFGDYKGITRDEILLSRTFQFFGEIASSIECLRNIEIYLRRYPYTNTRVTRAAHIRYHVENYFQELYILQNRCSALITMLRRSYRKQADKAVLDKAFSQVEKILIATLGNAIKVRGHHVHVWRYDDADLRQLSLLELLNTGDDKFKVPHKYAFQTVKNKKIKWVRENNKEIQKLMDMYCESLEKLLFSADGNFRYPTPQKTIS